MSVHNFFSVHVFEVKESIADFPTELPCSGELKNPGQLAVREVLLMILSYRFLKCLHCYGFEVGESIADIPTELPSSDNLTNLG